MICCGPLKMHLLVLRPLSVGLELRYISSVQQTALQRPGNGLPQKLLCLGVLGEGAQWGKSDNGRVRARERSGRSTDVDWASCSKKQVAGLAPPPAGVSSAVLSCLRSGSVNQSPPLAGLPLRRVSREGSDSQPNPFTNVPMLRS